MHEETYDELSVLRHIIHGMQARMNSLSAKVEELEHKAAEREALYAPAQETIKRIMADELREWVYAPNLVQGNGG